MDPDSEGSIKEPSGGVGQNELYEKAARDWATATRAHYSRDLCFNSQSPIVAMTERPCISGRAWPSIIFENREHEFAFALWCNSTLGLLMHWWVSNKTQSGRGTTTVTNIPTLDVTKLIAGQIAAARDAFEALRDHRFLPFDQIDEDPARAELDRRLLVGVLELPGVCARTAGQWICSGASLRRSRRFTAARNPASCYWSRMGRGVRSRGIVDELGRQSKGTPSYKHSKIAARIAGFGTPLQRDLNSWLEGLAHLELPEGKAAVLS